MKIKTKIKQTIGGLATLLAFALPFEAKATGIEAGFKYKQGTEAKPYITVSQVYKEGKTIFIGKVEKAKESPLALQVVGVYPLGKEYSVSAFEKVGVDPSFEPIYYLTGAGVGKSFGKGSVSLSVAGFKPKGSSKTSYSSSASGSYKIGKKAKLSGMVTISKESPRKPSFKVGLSYRVGK